MINYETDAWDTEKMRTGRLISHSLIESLLRGLGISESSPEMEQIARICGYVRRIPPREVQVEKYVELLHWLAKQFYPQLPESEGLFEIGAKLFEGYRTTIIGRVQLAAIHIMGPDRLIMRYNEITSRNSNFGERSITQTGPHSYQICYRGIPLPGDYILGVIKGGMTAAGVNNLQLSWQQVGKEDMDFQVAW
jgi:uncharacterized protein (TIGR02265 family)